ncbi:hypothetical protein PHET_00404, partial [Paragonimus heterotremus]
FFFSFQISDLQDYVTFCILHKYAGFVYKHIAKLKRKFLEHLAESFEMQHVEQWPVLLELASPGLRTLILQQWNWRYIEKSTEMIRKYVFQPLLIEFKALANLVLFNPQEQRELDFKLASMKMTIIESNVGHLMDVFYDQWKFQTNGSLLNQIVDFNTFISLKGLSPTFSVILDDPG